MFHRFLALAALFAAALTFDAATLSAHDGHDHAASPPPVSVAAAPRLEVASSNFELVAIREGDALRIWLDRFETNEAVRNAVIEVETPDGARKATPEPDGAYRLPAKWAATPGSYDLIFTVETKEVSDILSATFVAPKPAPALSVPAAAGVSPVNEVTLAGVGLGGLVIGALVSLGLRRRPMVWAPALALLGLVAFGAARLFAHEGHDRAAAAPLPAFGDHAQTLADGAIFVPKPTQRILAVLTRGARSADHIRRVDLPGRIIPDPNASGLVQAAAAARLSPPPGGFPRLGQRVQAGDILAYAMTPFLAIDQSTMLQQRGDLDQQISIVERRLARSETLAKSGAIALATLEDTRAELRGLRERRVSLDKAKRDAEPLRAPVAGVIASTNAIAGKIADPNATIFQIVDPKRLWVEALAFGAPPFSGAATARAADGRTLSLSLIGVGLADRNQAAPVDYAIEGAPEDLRLGQFVTVLADTADKVAGVAAPRESVVRRQNGENVVYEHSSAERFEARVVRTQPLDAERVLIVDGVKPGARVVTQASELLNQIR